MEGHWQNSDSPTEAGLGFQGEADSEGAPREISAHTVLDFQEMDAGVFEVLWRCLPPRTVAVPAVVVGNLVAALQLPHQVDGRGDRWYSTCASAPSQPVPVIRIDRGIREAVTLSSIFF